jgi:hypothetical protein
MKRIDVHVRGIGDVYWRWLRSESVRQGKTVAQLIEDLVALKVGEDKLREYGIEPSRG